MLFVHCQYFYSMHFLFVIYWSWFFFHLAGNCFWIVYSGKYILSLPLQSWQFLKLFHHIDIIDYLQWPSNSHLPLPALLHLRSYSLLAYVDRKGEKLQEVYSGSWLQREILKYLLMTCYFLFDSACFLT